MKVLVKDKKESAFPCDVLILPVTEEEGIKPYSDMDKALGGLLVRIVSSMEFTGKYNETSLVHTQGKVKPERLLLIGLGKEEELTGERLRQAGGKAASYLRSMNFKSTGLSTRTINPVKLTVADFVEGSLLSSYSFNKYKKEQKKKQAKNLIVLSKRKLNIQLDRAKAAAAAAHLARDMVNTPSNDMTPSSIVKIARSLKNVTVRVIDKKEAETLGMGAYLSVARGSNEPPKFIIITYKKKKTAPTVIIGKAITFDSGGISLKPAMGMEKMKYDMAGGAAIMGVMKAVSEMELPLHLIAILPATENLPSGTASKPGDVVTSINGTTIEIISTDAEGRLVLADAIGYAKRFKPSAIIDIATLTGACSIALGDEAAAMMGNNEALMDTMKLASEETGEKVWHMPLFDEYRDYIKSDIADIKNSAGRSGSLVTAGAFLKEFAGNVPWVHIDIAGTAWTDKERPYIPQGATGIGVRLLLSFLKSR
jgi:leucyl aminopeptidase